MTTIGAFIGLGLMIGSLGSAVWGCFLWSTRSYRREARRPLAIGLWYIMVGISSIGSLIVLLGILRQMDVGRSTPQDEAALYAYTASLALVGYWAFRSEIRWRRTVGLNKPKHDL